jgi:thymidylate synthase (FAD)
MNEAIEVLDHGLVRLVDVMGSDLSISRSARVSYDAPAREADDKLIGYLMKNRHTTPFESVQFTFEVKAPIFVFRQWHRHRTQSYNELSARYRELPAEFYIPELDQITTQSTDNKQMRTDEINPKAGTIQWLIGKQNEDAFEAYHTLLDLSCPRELARSVLPVGTYSHMFCSMNLHNCFHFLRLRLHSHAQYEIRVYAEAMLELIRPHVPIAVKHFEETL